MRVDSIVERKNIDRFLANLIGYYWLEVGGDENWK